MSERPLERGDIIRDNDPHMHSGHRYLQISGFETDKDDYRIVYALCVHNHRTRQYRIRVDRIKTDGKVRRYGFNRVSS